MPKGQIPWNKGKTLPIELRRKLSSAHLGKHASEETRAKMSRQRKGKKLSDEHKRKIGLANSVSCVGRRLSEETKRKISEANKGNVFSEEHCQNISKAKKGKPNAAWIGANNPIHRPDVKAKHLGENNNFYGTGPMLGRHFTEEHKKKISDGNRGKRRSPEAREKMSIGHKGRKASEATRRKMSEAQSGEKHSQWGTHRSAETRAKLSKKLSGENAPLWKGGISYEPYCPKFNEVFKERVRARFGRICFLCPTEEIDNGRKLSVHHIDYAKNSICNGHEWAFVPLCLHHHAKSNLNRWYWFNLLICYWAMNPEINFKAVELRCW